MRTTAVVLFLACALPMQAVAYGIPYGNPYGGNTYANPYGQAPAWSGGYAAPGGTLQGGIARLTGFLTSRPDISSGELRAFAERELSPYFDFEQMAWWAAGPLRRHLSPEQQAQLVNGVRGLFLQAMVANLSGYSPRQIEYLNPRGNPATGEVVLTIRAWNPQGYPIEVGFRLNRGADGWKVFDVVAEGTSAVAYYRRLLADMARRDGIDAMLAKLPGGR